MSIYTNGIEFIKKAPIGSCIYELIGFNKPESKEFTILVKDHSAYMSRFGKHPVFVVKSGIIYDEKVVLIPFMFSINGDDDMIYEMWINYWADSGYGREAFRQLLTQDSIRFIFFNENQEQVRMIKTKNSLKDGLIQAQRILQSFSPWSMIDFDNSRNQFLKSYPTVKNLFMALSKVSK